MDKDEANNAIKSAWIAGIIAGVIILVVSLIPNSPFGLGGLIEVFIYFSLTFGVYKKNRACAVIFFIYFVSFKIFQLIALGDWKPGPLALVISIFLFQGIRGTFAYHRIIKAETNREENESESIKKKSKKKPFLIGSGVAAAIVVVGFIIWASSLPESGVKMASEMHPYALEYIEKHNLLNDTEALIAYYDGSPLQDSTEAAILTTACVMYHKDGDTVSIDLKDIDDVSIDYMRKGPIAAHIIEVRSKSELRLKIGIVEQDKGELFYNALMDAWNLHKN